MKAVVSALGVAVAALSCSSYSLADEATSYDPSLQLTYKNYVWKDKRKAPAGTSYEDDEWVHALLATFDTGYIHNMGVVVTAGVADPLSTGDNFTHVPEKTKNGPGHSIAGFQQGYLKGRYTWDDFRFDGSLGVKKRGYKLYSDSGSRVLAASSRGLDLSAGYRDFDLYLGWINGHSRRNHSRFSGDLTADYIASGAENSDAKVDGVGIIGAGYSWKGLELAIEYMDADELLRKNFYQGIYTWNLAENKSLVFDLHYGQARSGGVLHSDPNYRSSYYLMNTKFNIAGAYAAVGYGRTMDGNWDDASDGDYNAGNFSQPSEWASYNFEGERSYLLGAGYDFSGVGVSGLHWDLAWAQGSNAKRYTGFKRRELSSYISYAFGGKLDGLSLSWLYANYKVKADAAADADVAVVNGRVRGSEFNLEYTLSVF